MLLWSKYRSVLASLLWMICLVSSANGQPVAAAGTPLSELKSDPTFKLWGENSEVKKCGICHFSPGNDFAQRDTDFCSLEEVRLWLQSDKHAVSRQRIEPFSREEVKQLQIQDSNNWIGESNVVSFEMCRKLNYELQTDAGYAKFRDNCLTCHAGYDPNRVLDKQIFSRSSNNQPGITCNYCHQAQDNTSTTWIDKHGGFSAKQEWRLLPPEQKTAAGMRNLIDVPIQAQLCAECHIGDHASGKFVTHEMYVAGHPPLPNFELHTFLAGMPPHWRDLKTTYAKFENQVERDRYFALNVPRHGGSIHKEFGADSCWDTRTMLIGAVQAAEQTIALVSQSEQANHWGNYALYDCSACHHELRLPSIRQQRQTAEVPGRPRLLEWPSALLDTAAAVADTNGNVERARRELWRAVNQTPFGDPQVCVDKAQEVKKALRIVGETLAMAAIQPELAKSILKKLTQTSKDRLLDYHAARQVILAIRVIDNELSEKNTPLPRPTRDLIAKLGQQGDQTLVSVALPAGRHSTHYPTQSAHPSTGYLFAELERLRLYDAQAANTIYSQLNELCQQL